MEGFVAEDYPGHNTLRGESPESYRARLKRAWHGPGAQVVDRRTAEGRRADERILDELCWRLGRIGLPCGDLEVRVHDGEVHLGGAVPDAEARESVERDGATIQGVERVASSLRIP